MMCLGRRMAAVTIIAGGLCQSGEATGFGVFAEAWGGTESEAFNSVIATSDGCYVATGYTCGTPPDGRNFLVAKFDRDGELLWSRIGGGGEDEEGRSVIETHDGDLIMVGYTKSRGDGSDFLLARLALSTGDLEWIKTWGGGIGHAEELYQVIESSDDELWAVGYTGSLEPDDRMKVIVGRIDPSGSEITYAGAYKLLDNWNIRGYALAEVFGTDGMCVAGLVEDDDFLGFKKEMLLAKFSLTPGYLWAYRIGLEDDHEEEATSILRTSDGCLVLAGSEVHFNGIYDDHNGLFLKTDDDAIVDWGRAARVSYFTSGRGVQSLLMTGDGHVVTAGYDHDDQFYDDRLFVTKWDYSGNEVWNRAYESGHGCTAASVCEDDCNSLLAVGATEGYGQGEADALLVRCQSEGLTCMDDVGGPDYSNWSPAQTEIILVGVTGPALEPEDWYYMTGEYETEATSICGPIVHTVCPDGTADFERIQDAIDFASEGDIVELCDAVFVGDGNRDLDFQGKKITLRSQSGNPDNCIIDVEGSDGHRGFFFHNGEGHCSVVEGVTVRNGGPYMEVDQGGGILCVDASPTINNCRFVHCDALSGGGIYCDFASPVLTDCVFYDDFSDNCGGAAYCYYSSPTFSGCTLAGCFSNGPGGAVCGTHSPMVFDHCAFTGNDTYADGGSARFYQCDELTLDHCTFAGSSADNGGAISFVNSEADIRNSIFWGDGASSGVGEEIWNYSSILDFTCCDVDPDLVEGNGAAYWHHVNITEDPLFCNPRPCDDAPTTGGDYHLHPDSPCAPDNNPPCGLIGALPAWCTCYVDFEPFNADDGTWGDYMADIDEVFGNLANWGECPYGPCRWDCHPLYDDGTWGDGQINIDDVFEVLANWGPCP